MEPFRLLCRLGSFGAALAAALVLASCSDDDAPPEAPDELLVFIVGDGDTQTLVTASLDGAETHTIPFPGTSAATAGRYVLLSGEGTVEAMLPNGSERRDLYRAPVGKRVEAGPASPDGSMVTIFESNSKDARDAVVVINLADGRELQRYQPADADFEGFVGGLYEVRWHDDSAGLTVGSGGVQIDGGFRQSFAALRFDGVHKVTVTDASSAASPDGRLLVESLPAEPGCMGFVSTHSLRIIDLLSGDELASAREPERGLRLAGWFRDMSGPAYLSLADAGCHPAEQGDTLRELPADGSPPREVHFDPWAREEERAAERYQIGMSCGAQPANPISLMPGGASGCSGFGGPMVLPDMTVTPTPQGADRGQLFIGGRVVASMRQFTFVGTVRR